MRNPFGRYAKSIEYQDGVLLFQARNPRRIHLDDITSAPILTDGLWGSDLTFHFVEASSASLLGASKKSSADFAEVVEADWIAHNKQKFEASRQTIDVLLGAVAELAKPTRYPAACLVAPHLETARRLEADLLAKLPATALNAKAGMVVSWAVSASQGAREKIR